MKPIFIGIAGGSGSGKSTLATTLMDKYPDKIGLVQLDDYFKPETQVPQLEGHSNWDHPNALFLDRLTKDLEDLSLGKSVIINTKNERLNPDYPKTDKRIPVEFQPKQIMLVEGYLVLYDKRIRNLLAASIWLELDHKTRWSRRVHFKYPEYEEKVLMPMQAQFAEPTKRYATHAINVSGLPRDAVVKKAEKIVQAYL